MKRYRFLAITLILASVLVLPHFMNPFVIRLVIITLFWAYLGQCWNIMGGYAGQFSFGHSAFFGLGAYTSTVLLVNCGVNPWIGMVIGGVVAMMFGLFIGFVSFRYGLRGIYFALATLAFSEILLYLALNLEYVNKSMGIQIPLRGSDSWLYFQFEGSVAPYYYIILGMVALSLAVVYAIERNKLGYYFKAINQDEDASASLGVNTFRYKMYAMAISCSMTALGGTFYAQYFLFIDPDLVFGVHTSIEMILRPIVGGYGTVFGPIVGAMVLTPLSEFTRTIVREPPSYLPFLQALKGKSGIDLMLYGLILMIFIIFFQHGLLGLMRNILRKLRAARYKKNIAKPQLARGNQK